LLYVVSINTAGKSFAIDAGLAVFAFVLSKVWMISILNMMPLYNAVGAGAIVAVELSGNKAERVVRLIAAFIGAMSVSGSLIAWIKLNGIINKPLRVRGQQTFSLVLMVAALAVASYIVFTAPGGVDMLIATPWLVGLLFGFALILGALTTLPIGGVQVPAAILIYNALTALVVSLEGFALRSPMLILAGVVVGTARILTTLQMVTDRSADIGDGPATSAARRIVPSMVPSHE
jgi:NAD(P) transhydrogenase subunit beta